MRRELPDHRHHLRIERSGNGSGGHRANRINSGARRTLSSVLWLEETLQRLRRSTMNFRILASFASAMLAATFAAAGNPSHSELHVLPPVTRGNLSIFPVVGGAENDTARLLTLDEGLRSGSVVVTEAGSLRGLVRPGSPVAATIRGRGEPPGPDQQLRPSSASARRRGGDRRQAGPGDRRGPDRFAEVRAH